MSYIVLARKYRPLTFEDMVGQEHLTRTLKNAIEQDRVHHAYLFSGARGLGKTTAARIFAKGLVCERGPTAQPCNACEQCVSVNEGRSVDVVEIDGASNNSVENIRNLREQVNYLPQSARRKVYIIDEVHMLTTSAFNALLKTLEEPPAHVNFIFATTEPHKVLPTILSRVSRLEVRRLSPAGLVAHLQNILQREGLGVEEEGLRIIAHASGGSVRDSLTLLDQVLAFADDNRAVQTAEVRAVLGLAERSAIGALVDAVLARDPGVVMQQFDALVAGGHDLMVLAQQILEDLRDLMLVRLFSTGSNDSGLEVLRGATPSELVRLQERSRDVEPAVLSQLFDRLTRVVDRMPHSRVQRLLLEMALLELTYSEPLMPLAELADKLAALGGDGGGPDGGGAGGPRGGGGSPPRSGGSRRDAGERASTFRGPIEVVEAISDDSSPRLDPAQLGRPSGPVTDRATAQPWAPLPASPGYPASPHARVDHAAPVSAPRAATASRSEPRFEARGAPANGQMTRPDGLVTPTREPALARPEPATHRPEPATHRPEPATHRPEPATHRPEPATHRPEPATHRPEPAALRPEPATHRPDVRGPAPNGAERLVHNGSPRLEPTREPAPDRPVVPPAGQPARASAVPAELPRASAPQASAPMRPAVAAEPTARPEPTPAVAAQPTARPEPSSGLGPDIGDSEIARGLWALGRDSGLLKQSFPEDFGNEPAEPPPPVPDAERQAAPPPPREATPAPAAAAPQATARPAAAVAPPPEPSQAAGPCGGGCEPTTELPTIDVDNLPPFAAWERLLDRIRDEESFFGAVLSEVGLVSLSDGVLRVAAAHGSFAHTALLQRPDIRAHVEQATRDHFGRPFQLELIEGEPSLPDLPSVVLVEAHRKREHRERIEREAREHAAITTIVQLFSAQLTQIKPLQDPPRE